MKTILVFCKKALTQNQLENLDKSLDNMNVIYCDNKVAPDILEDADIILGNPNPSLLSYCKKLKLLQLVSAGTNGYPENLPNGAILANATGGYGLAISEHLLASLLYFMKKLNKYHDNQKQHLWHDEGVVTSVLGSTVLVIGLGDIGGEFAKRVKALGAHTIGVKRTGTDKPDYIDELYYTNDIEKLLPKADVVALCLPSTSETDGLMSQEYINLMKNGSILLNVGRGSAIDQTALSNALKSGHLRGASIDVTTPEPLPEDHFLWDTPNLLITPHVSGSNHLEETFNRILELALHNIDAVYSGGALKSEVDLSTGYRKL